MNHMLSIREVSKSFGNHKALDTINLEIPENAIFGLLGPNGAGKTTLIRIINQITYPDSGEVLFAGEPLKPEHIAQIGYLPEERGLYKSMKVGEQALYLAQLKGLSRAEAKKRLLHWFEKLEIGDWWNRKVQELSKGMAQKIQFIVTVLHEPRLLIFDEPFSGFDPINAALIKDRILELKDQGASIIFSTHRMESVEELCEYIGLIHNSRLILEGKLSAIRKAHKDNRYRVCWEPATTADGLAVIEKSFTVNNPRFDAEEGSWDFELKLEEDQKAEALAILAGSGNLATFQEWIPSANDIFIQTVKNQESHA